jgi:hypothetical protein
VGEDEALKCSVGRNLACGQAAAYFIKRFFSTYSEKEQERGAGSLRDLPSFVRVRMTSVVVAMSAPMENIWY